MVAVSGVWLFWRALALRLLILHLAGGKIPALDPSPRLHLPGETVAQ
jgi:hypothetical protein